MRTQADINAAYEAGRYLYSSFNKNITVTMGVGVAQDLSGLPGNPVAQYYLGAVGTSTGLYRSTDWGLNHGQNVDTKKILAYRFTQYGNCHDTDNSKGFRLPYVLSVYWHGHRFTEFD